MDKRLFGILALIAALFIGIAVFAGHSKNSSSNGSKNSGVQPTNHVEGSGKSGVTLIEYGDYECPVCQVYYLPLKQVAAKYNDQVYFQFRNLPLVQVHLQAFASARAAEAAALQNKFWEMHDALYDNQKAWSTASNPSDSFNQYAQNLGLDLDKFKKDYSSSYVNNLINADLAAFGKTGQEQGTPTFFLDGKYIANSQLVDQNGQPSIDKFSKIIDSEIAQKGKKQ